MIGIKFCGMMRVEDADRAVAEGASHIGVIFAPSRRRVGADGAAAIVEAVRGRASVVGVFGAAPASEVAALAREVGLDAVQLHSDPGPADVAAVRAAFDGEVWAAYRVRGGHVGPEAFQLAEVADGLVLDAHHADALGGTGRTLPWTALVPALVPLRARRASIVLAGGLDPTNVWQAIGLVAPDIVDVASGVETSPGIKDPDKLHAFAMAVRIAARAAETIE